MYHSVLLSPNESMVSVLPLFHRLRVSFIDALTSATGSQDKAAEIARLNATMKLKNMNRDNHDFDICI